MMQCNQVWSETCCRDLLFGARRAMATGTRVLVVEDDFDIRSAVAESLFDEGYTVVTARDGLEALNIASLSPPHVIVLDLMMPTMDGWTFLARCRAQPWCREVPVVVMSAAHALRMAGERLRDLGVRAVIPKPFDLETLISTVRACAPPVSN
jgi:CheY-like chemotaxis protein